MRIISGAHRGRRLDAPSGRAFRPTSGKTREAMFNLLTHGKFNQSSISPIQDAVVADICCGTGALGLEALSRGAKHAVLVDKSPESLTIARANAERFGELERITLLRRDAAHLSPAQLPCNIVLIDPPYKDGLVTPILDSLVQQGWLAANALVVAETSARQISCDILPGVLTLCDHRQYGSTSLTVWRHEVFEAEKQ